MKKILLVLICLLLITGCKKDNKYAIDFKNEYESLNGVVNKNGKEYRTITIDKNNPYIKITPDKIVEMINNKESFFLYVGDKLCPWCRSVLEKSIEVSKSQNINKIYYIDIWDDDKNEILRDKYTYDEKLTKVVEGTEAYEFLLEKFDSVLSDYTLTDSDGNKIEVGEKRIFAPNYFYVKNGKVIKMIDGISEKQKDSKEELTKEILDDEETEFVSLFRLANICDDNGC